MPNDPHTMLMRSRALRQNMTREEKHLYYDGLKKMPYKFRRQVVIGNYIVDFCCLALRLVIEVDGTQHFLPPGRKHDQARDAWLRQEGYHLVRYSNADINQRFEAVCTDILKHCGWRASQKMKHGRPTGASEALAGQSPFAPPPHCDGEALGESIDQFE